MIKLVPYSYGVRNRRRIYISANPWGKYIVEGNLDSKTWDVYDRPLGSRDEPERKPISVAHKSIKLCEEWINKYEGELEQARADAKAAAEEAERIENEQIAAMDDEDLGAALYDTEKEIRLGAPDRQPIAVTLLQHKIEKLQAKLIQRPEAVKVFLENVRQAMDDQVEADKLKDRIDRAANELAHIEPRDSKVYGSCDFCGGRPLGLNCETDCPTRLINAAERILEAT